VVGVGPLMEATVGEQAALISAAAAQDKGPFHVFSAHSTENIVWRTVLSACTIRLAAAARQPDEMSLGIQFFVIPRVALSTSFAKDPAEGCLVKIGNEGVMRFFVAGVHHHSPRVPEILRTTDDRTRAAAQRDHRSDLLPRPKYLPDSFYFHEMRPCGELGNDTHATALKNSGPV